MAQVVNRCSPTTVTWVRDQVNPRVFVAEKWNRGRFFFDFFGFPLSVSFHRGCIFIYHVGMNNSPVDGRSSETQSHPVAKNKLRLVLH
jgi:hypothetical protein